MRLIGSLAHWLGLLVLAVRQHDAEIANGTRLEILRDEVHRLRVQVAHVEHQLAAERRQRS